MGQVGSKPEVWASCMKTSPWSLRGQQCKWDCSLALPVQPHLLFSLLSPYLCGLIPFLKLLFFFIVSMLFQEEGHSMHVLSLPLLTRNLYGIP